MVILHEDLCGGKTQRTHSFSETSALNDSILTFKLSISSFTESLRTLTVILFCKQTFQEGISKVQISLCMALP